ncbi:MAG: fused MFS/spermidine synthase [Deltaproteobacteria bacterium]|nr:fused MFS/spermidine synthase [Deltaproteobacteria bacterium]
MPVFFAVTLFISSALLFMVQPMVAKMLLPSLGGTPGVWNTCMVFFQAGLLAGYAYAHAGLLWLGLRKQSAVHLGFVLLPLLVLPNGIAADAEPPEGVYPVLWLLRVLLVSVGLPYVVVATCGPLLQKWFAGTGHTAGKDPYFLYASSNLGSMLALILYPVVIEPNFALATQRSLWIGGFYVLVALILGCAVCVWRARPASVVVLRFSSLSIPPTEKKNPSQKPHEVRSAPASSAAPALTWVRRLRWLGLAATPSSLMLSVTTYLTADIASIPLLWVMPISLYLLTFTLVFARRTLLPHAFMVRWMPLAVLIPVLIIISEATETRGSALLLIALHLLGLFWICMVCHGELAHTRPAAKHLTEFYLWLAVGGVLGSLFTALVAPVVFNTVVEYPLALVLACLLKPGEDELVQKKSNPPVHHRSPRTAARLDMLLPAMIGLFTAVLVLAGQALDLPAGPISVAVMFAVPAVMCYTFMRRPVRFGLGIGAILLASTLYAGVHGRAEYQVRSFFGVHRVTRDATGNYRRLIHGNTVHGQQSLNPEQREEPLTYYHRKGPIGQLLQALDGDPRLRRVAIVGLGAGTLASYAQPRQYWTYFEIDPVVVQIAEDSSKFTYLHDARRRLLGSGGKIDVVVGDARLTLRKSDGTFGLIIIDAFTSDAIPLHLLTREALQIYRSKLTAGGIIALNISNRHLDLKHAMARLAEDARPPMVCLVQEDTEVTSEERAGGKSPSVWALLSTDRAALGKLLDTSRGRWIELSPPPGASVWTDDFSNVFEVIRWR